MANNDEYDVRLRCSQCAPGNDVTRVDPFRCLFMAASAEKEDMICLNDRLGDVVLKVEKLRSGKGQDSSTFIKAIDCLKEEIKKIKTAYDLELSRLRCVYLNCSNNSPISRRAVFVWGFNSLHKVAKPQMRFKKCIRG